MRRIAIMLLLGVCLVPAAWAKYTGIVLSTPFPDETVQSGRTAVIPLTVHNFGLDPQAVTLKTLSVAKGWTAEFQGDARDVAEEIGNHQSSQQQAAPVAPAGQS